MAPSTCCAVQLLLLLLLPCFSVTLTAPFTHPSFISPLFVETSGCSDSSSLPASADPSPQTPKESSSEYSQQPNTHSPSEFPHTSKSTPRLPVAPLPPPRFPLTYDGLFRRRRRCAPFRKPAQDTQYPYDEAPIDRRARLARRSLHSHSPHRPWHATADHHGPRRSRKYEAHHESTRVNRKANRIVCFLGLLGVRFPCLHKAHHKIKSGRDYYSVFAERTVYIPAGSHQGFIDIYGIRPYALRRKRDRHESHVRTSRRGVDAVYIFENSPDAQGSLSFGDSHHGISFSDVHKYSQNADNMPSESDVHIQQVPGFYKVRVPFHERGSAENFIITSGPRKQFPDDVNHLNVPNNLNDRGTHLLHPSKDHKFHTSFGFRDALYGPGSPYSRRLRYGGSSSKERNLRHTVHTV